MADFRHVAGVKFEINGRRLETIGLGIRLLDLQVSMRDDLMSDFTASLLIDEVRDSADEVFDEFGTIDITMEFPDDELYLGRYFLMAPNIGYIDPVSRVLILRGLGESSILDIKEHRRAFISQKDSEIATFIANEHKLTAEITDTLVEYPRVQQLNLTNLEFLRERAEIYGYVMDVRNGIMYFGPRRQQLIPGNLSYGDQESLVDKVTVKPNWHRRARPLTVSGWDPIQKRLLNSTWTGEKNGIMQFLEVGTSTDEMRDVFTVMNSKGSQQDYRVVDTHLENQTELNTLTNSKGFMDAMAIYAEVRLRGLTGPVMAGNTMLLTGIPPYSAQYYVRQVDVRFHAEGKKSFEMTLMGETHLVNRRVNTIEDGIGLLDVYADDARVIDKVAGNTVNL